MHRFPLAPAHAPEESALLLALLATRREDLRLNQIQVIGSHNSYHFAPPADSSHPEEDQSTRPDAWNYTHPPLAAQLERGVRQFELDVFADSKGGLFSDPLGLKLARLAGART